jgi:phage protein D
MSLTDLNLRQLDWDIEWPFKDKIRDIDTRCIQFSLSYKEHGEASEFRMTLDNSDKFFTKNTLFDAGMKVKFFLHYALQPKRLMGEFVIDEISDTDVPSSIEVCGISADCVTKGLKTKKTKGFENQSLKSIVENVGKDNGMTVNFHGKDILLKRKDQKECHDLKFINDLAELYGFRFRIEGNIIYFLDRSSIHITSDKKPIKGLISTRTFSYKAHKGAKSSEVRYYDPEKNTILQVQNEKQTADAQCNKEIKTTQKVNSLEEANMISKAQLDQANDHQYECSLDCQGDPDFIPPFNIIVEDEGVWDGEWHIAEAEHNYSKQSGYRMTLKGYKL